MIGVCRTPVSLFGAEVGVMIGEGCMHGLFVQYLSLVCESNDCLVSA